MPKTYAVVMAGGRGERFWPLSTDQRSKPFIALLGTRTLIQETVDRLIPLIPGEQILISIGPSHHDLARGQLPEIPAENFIVEPVGRDTSACLGFCALHLERRDPDAIMLAVPSDHFIRDAANYRACLQRGIDHAAASSGVVFGVKPSRPESGYGYIQARPPAAGETAWPVIRFVEKPDPATAESYIRSGDYFWNSGMFLWRNATLLELFRAHMPETYASLSAMRPLLGQKSHEDELHRVFSTLQRISVDFGILQKMSGLSMIPADFTWDDIGSWTALERALQPDASGNVAHGAHSMLDSQDCTIFSDEGVVATLGVSNLVVIHANGKVLVCAKERAADLKRLLQSVGEQFK